MNLLSPQPFWPIRDGLPDTYPSLTGSASSQVVILGAGISGALAAWHLAEAGVDVIVVDRREVATAARPAAPVSCSMKSTSRCISWPDATG